MENVACFLENVVCLFVCLVEKVVVWCKMLFGGKCSCLVENVAVWWKMLLVENVVLYHIVR